MYLARGVKREKKEKEFFENSLLKETEMGKKLLNTFLLHFPAISGFGDFLTLLELKPLHFKLLQLYSERWRSKA